MEGVAVPSKKPSIYDRRKLFAMPPSRSPSSLNVPHYVLADFAVNLITDH